MTEMRSEHRNFDRTLAEANLETLFVDTLKTIRATIGDRAFRLESLVNAALADAIWVGVAERVRSQGPVGPSSKGKLKSAHDRLLAQPEFKTAVTRATANEESIQTRLDLAVKAFAKA